MIRDTLAPMPAALWPEQQITHAIVSTALALGYAIAVLSDGYDVLRRSSDSAAILAAVESVDEIELRFYLPHSLPWHRCVGWVLLIAGNGTDVISAAADNDATRAILAPAESLAERLASAESAR